MSDLQSLIDLYRYNRWANARVFAFCQDLDPAIRRENEPGSSGSLEETLKHLVLVETAYLTFLEGRDPQSLGSIDDFLAHDFAWFVDRLAKTGDGLSAFLANADGSTLDQELSIPWIKARLTRRDGLLQAATHSTQHRAQVFSILGGRGMKVPGLDYVIMVGEAQGISQP